MAPQRQRKTSSWLVLTFGLSLLISGHSSIAEIYKTVDEKGKVTFSDQPSPSADPVELRETNTAQPVRVPLRIDMPAEGLAELGYTNIAITSPANDSVIANGLLPFTVSTSISPALKTGHQLQLLVDGSAHSSSQGDFIVNGISRGPHQLQVNVIDTDGKVLERSAVIKVFAYRPSSS